MKLALLAGAVALCVALPALAQETPTPEAGPTESVPTGPRVEVEVAGWLYSVQEDALFSVCVIEQRADFDGVWDTIRLFVLQPDGNFEATGPYPAQAVGPLDGVPQGECVALDRLQP
jgi:hypothetical protein